MSYGESVIDAETPGQALAIVLGMGRNVLWDGDTSREAKMILAHVLGIAPDKVAALELKDYTEEVLERYLELVQLRARGVPMSHVLGYRDFWKHRFKVTSDVLDPRPDTETLVELALRQPFERVLDLGTGSGCILISLLADSPKATGVGCDVSEVALLVAEHNAKMIGVADRVRLQWSNWFENVKGQFDLIVSNPPYIAKSEMAALQPEVRDYEPRLALTDENDGLDAYRAIAKGAADYLSAQGHLLVEIGPTQAKAVSALFQASGLEKIIVHPDLDGRDRVVAARKSA